ncbi:hypothetical protein LEP1GSC188_2518 [Leptospira weilii serovar Topaz str. LT2116]|uniref:Uncharacterized protein n=1 Tax=Leptospira weilii serovar Topaz str. LT2116 TaxID=1088540 RepID=M3EGG8_9LEPT|nr:hypothetical protein LEP1GSC188_2518 [Leptospira weilii serovar Topaz str. LT2116]
MRLIGRKIFKIGEFLKILISKKRPHSKGAVFSNYTQNLNKEFRF